ncbi:MAG: heme lyase CcmF/NrfE family subunit [Dehalococcoidales bacterium]|nr:heme lyase CcmF/NrfE family subunit [Dehalococcoidales bacterium]
MSFGYTDIGYAALLIAFIAAGFSAISFIVGKVQGYSELLEAGRRAVYAVCGLFTLASLVMIYALVSRDFGVSYVAQYTDRALSLPYTLSAFWAGQEGSLLFWGWLLSIFAVIVLVQNRTKHRELMPFVMAILMATTTFFLMLLTMVTPPFLRLPSAPADGQGLNPLLQNMGMFFHPPTTYLGYVGFAIPFAFAMAALITGKVDDEWIRSTRRWTLFAWFFLSLGNFFGAQWAYVELGWGGFWAWDPVENASFMPWLTGTAYLHSVMIQQRRGMLKVWNMVLIIVTYALTIFGTFLTRSGILSSVHSFGQSNLGPFFLAFIAMALVLSVGLLIDRLPYLRSENELDSMMSRESSFLLNNLILLGAAVATFWGVIFPLVSEAVRGVKITVSMPFFNQVNGPIFLGLLLIMGICPLIGWRKASKENLIRNFLYPTVLTIGFAVIAYVLGLRDIYALIAVSLCVFVVSVIILEIWRGTRARRRTAGENYLVALCSLVWHNKPRYGGYIVHLSIVMIAMGIIGAFAFKTEVDATVTPGDMINVDRFSLKYGGLSEYPRGDKDVVAASVEVYNGGKRVGYVYPAKLFTAKQEQPTTEVAIRTTAMEDLYVILGGWDKDQSASFKVLVNPLVVWIWIGGAVMLLGTAIAFWPDEREKRRLDARYRAGGA